MTTATRNAPATAASSESRPPSTSVWAFDQVQTPGAYVVHNTGHLVRVPEDALSLGRSPLVDIVANEPMLVSKISENPYLPLTKARILACDADLPVNF